MIPELLRRSECHRSAGRGGRAGVDEELLDLVAGVLKVLEVNENLNDLPEVLGAQPLDKRLADLFGQEFIERLGEEIS